MCHACTVCAVNTGCARLTCGRGTHKVYGYLLATFSSFQKLPSTVSRNSATRALHVTFSALESLLGTFWTQHVISHLDIEYAATYAAMILMNPMILMN